MVTKSSHVSVNMIGLRQLLKHHVQAATFSDNNTTTAIKNFLLKEQSSGCCWRTIISSYLLNLTVENSVQNTKFKMYQLYQSKHCDVLSNKNTFNSLNFELFAGIKLINVRLKVKALEGYVSCMNYTFYFYLPQFLRSLHIKASV